MKREEQRSFRVRVADSIQTVNPTTAQPIERIDRATPADVDRLLTRAQRAQRGWAAAELDERAAALRTVAKRLRERRDELARIAVTEMGKPVTQARAEVEKCAFGCEYFADRGAEMLAQVESPSNATRSYVAFRPLGVLLAIMPWNFPYWQTFRAGIPALLAGNVILLKHAAPTTRCGIVTEEIFAGAFDGGPILQTLLVSDEEADDLIADPRVACVTLTGSERAGVAVAAAAGRALKKCVLELGGSDAFIVLRDADLAKAVETAVVARFQNNGQSCIAAKRFIVEDAVYDEFSQRFVAAAKALRVGEPLDDATQLGPCARADLRDAIDRQVKASVGSGARLLCGGRFVERDGFFYEPTVVDGVRSGMPMYYEETFGPAAALMRTPDPAAAVVTANDSRYGLGCNIWTADVERAQRMASSIEAGNVWINGMVASDPRLPFGGVKLSGFGRELSPFGIHEFANVQSVWIGPAR
ncbi:MAG: NAD-dependent succinate-semialdehyde dehydrogenase [Candidatus Tyrphobacter sp.]